MADRITIETHEAFADKSVVKFSDPQAAAEHVAHLLSFAKAPAIFVLNAHGNTHHWTQADLLALVEVRAAA